MYTRLGLELLKKQVEERSDDNAMQSTCSEYQCDCHELVPRLLADLTALHDVVGQIKDLTGRLPVGVVGDELYKDRVR